MTIYGSDFFFDGNAVPIGTTLTLADMGGSTTKPLSGILADGTPFSNDVAIISNGSIHLVPEPSTVWLAGLGILGLGLYGWCRKRRP